MTPSPRAEARWIVEAATGRELHRLLSDDLPLDSSAVGRVSSLVARRKQGEPLQYVTGLAGFRRLDLAVGPGVLIPRPETELVAGKAMELLPPSGILVDAGAGSGAIALSVADERPDATVLATELSPGALEWARRNVERTGLSVTLLEGDLLTPLEGVQGGLLGRVDVVVSNPPYVSWAERDLLPAEVVEHEPQEALFATQDGIGAIARLIDESMQWLSPGGHLVMEIGERHGDEVRALLSDAAYEDAEVLPDLSGRQRMAVGRRPQS